MILFKLNLIKSTKYLILVLIERCAIDLNTCEF